MVLNWDLIHTNMLAETENMTGPLQRKQVKQYPMVFDQFYNQHGMA